ncbi:MAG: hypothetical protein DWI69_08725 [Chloroflexi bacterium]|nr:MAG: hypothetical protein DWI69_08725 [Chloroflexota bacterium]
MEERGQSGRNRRRVERAGRPSINVAGDQHPRHALLIGLGLCPWRPQHDLLDHEARVDGDAIEVLADGADAPEDTGHPGVGPALGMFRAVGSAGMVRAPLGRDARTQVGANRECGLVEKAAPAAVAEGQWHPPPIARQLGWILQLDGPSALNLLARGYPSCERRRNIATYATRDFPHAIALSKT